MEIRVEGLCKSYGGKQVLTDLSAVFLPGITCISAPSGTGKTTLLRLLLGLEEGDGGAIYGADCRWAAVFQEDRLLENLSPAANLRFALGEIPEAAGAMLEDLGLELADARPVCKWSGGMRRRLALARALLAPAEALALDEPFAGLDRESRERCLAWIRRAASEKPVLLATHELAGLENVPVLRLA
ncbi:MAG: ATP-binding cassette domain-containing protein [Oscillibacter sp.]|nr:ATP-binding cassette domain-containing protein [Oscillibacter sp.]